MELNATTFASLVDHTLLKPEATRQDIEALCQEAVAMGTKSVCVNSMWVPIVAEQLRSSAVLTCTVVGFPLGAANLASLEAETKQALSEGAKEVDMVLPFGAVLGGDWAYARDAIQTVRKASEGATLKVILESAALGLKLTEEASQLAVDLGADFLKTSTGFHATGGADVESVEIMRRIAGTAVGVKASGGIRTLSDVERMVAAGANRLGMSATAAVLAEIKPA